MLSLGTFYRVTTRVHSGVIMSFYFDLIKECNYSDLQMLEYAVYFPEPSKEVDVSKLKKTIYVEKKKIYNPIKKSVNQ